MTETISKERNAKAIYFLTRDTGVCNRLASRLAGHDLRLERLDTLSALAAAIETAPPAILVLDSLAISEAGDVARLLVQAEVRYGVRPSLICIAGPENIELRLQALRAGADAFFVAPVTVEQLAERLLELGGVLTPKPLRVLVVDDQPVAATFAARVLASAGMATRKVGDALSVLDAIGEFEPDLILMDLHMPGANGIELTAIIRDFDDFAHTPIVFLSAELDVGVQMDALRVGGNDFIAKPVDPKRLIAVVEGRIRASRSAPSRPRLRAIAGVESEVGDRVSLAMEDGPQQEARLLGLIQDSLRSNGFELRYQPIVALRQMPGERYETTLNLRVPDGKSIQGPDFLSVAKRQGLVPQIDRWLMANALDELQRQREAHHGLRFFVQQSMTTLAASDWVPWFRGQIADRDLIKLRPVLQFQLQDVAEHVDVAARRFKDLKRLGIRVCLNEIEDEPSALGLLGVLPVSLVRLSTRMVTDTTARRLARLVQYLHELSGSVIAPGIESPQTIAFVWRAGVDFIQGDFLQRPEDHLNFDFSEAALV